MFGSQTVNEVSFFEIMTSARLSKNDVMTMINCNNINVNNNQLADDYKQNLLHIAVKNYHYEFAKFLIKKKIDKSKKNIFNETPLDIAIKNHDTKMIEILLEFNNSINNLVYL